MNVYITQHRFYENFYERVLSPSFTYSLTVYVSVPGSITSTQFYKSTFFGFFSNLPEYSRTVPLTISWYQGGVINDEEEGWGEVRGGILWKSKLIKVIPVLVVECSTVFH